MLIAGQLISIMNLTKIKRLTPFFLIIWILFPAREMANVITFGTKGVELYNARIRSDGAGRERYSLDDQSYSGKSIPFITDLVLSFNRPSSTLSKDDTGSYEIREASYELARDHGVMGGGGASFFKRDHRVEIQAARGLWLGNCTDLGSFTIECRVFLTTLAEGGVIFSSMGYGSGKKSGIELVVKNRRLTARLLRVFTSSEGRRIDVSLSRGSSLSENRWHHIALSFDRVSGKLALLINGEEREVVYATESGEPFNGVFTPSFICEDLPVALVGKNFYGIIDELRISHRHIGDLKRETDIALKNYRETGIIGRLPANREGVVTSPIYEFPLTGTRIINFEWDESLPGDSFVWIELRVSDDLFERNGEGLKWYRIVNRQRNIYLKKADGLFLRGKYYQWRAHLIASPDGRNTSVLGPVSLHYQLDQAPRAPLFVQRAGVGDASVRLRWKKNVEHDILGYRLYYGIHSRRYDGVISSIGGKRIANEMSGGKNFIEVEITNEVIEENMTRDAQRYLTYPLLKNNVLYYFAVRAYDSYRPDTKYNHESELSEEISIRPFAGSEIDK